MSKYRITLKPCEAYFFGDENTFRIDQPKENYFIKSLSVPPAASIIGMLRYVLLEQQGLLKTGRKYTDEDREAMGALIGKVGYCVGEENDLGAVKEISPLFITDEQGAIYIPVPLNHKTSEETYTPISLTENKYETSFGTIRLPAEDELDAKKLVGDWYMNIETGEIIDDMFEHDERVGIDKGKAKEAFFKKSYVRLKKGYSFAFNCEVDVPLKDTICYMGRERSAFVMTVEESDEDIAQRIESVFDGSFYYAFGDLIIKNKLAYKDYAMVKTGSVRMLTSKYGEDGRLTVNPDAKHFNVIKSGSVFYAKPDENMFYEDKYGFNKIIKLGGIKK